MCSFLAPTSAEVNHIAINDPVLLVAEPEFTVGTLHSTLHSSICQVLIAFLHIESSLNSVSSKNCSVLKISTQMSMILIVYSPRIVHTCIYIDFIKAPLNIVSTCVVLCVP